MWICMHALGITALSYHIRYNIDTMTWTKKYRAYVIITGSSSGFGNLITRGSCSGAVKTASPLSSMEVCISINLG